MPRRRSQEYTEIDTAHRGSFTEAEDPKSGLRDLEGMVRYHYTNMNRR